LFGAKKFPGEGLHFLAVTRINGSENFVERIKLAEIKFLAADWTCESWWIPEKAMTSL